MFDFTLFRRSGFNGWSNGPPQKVFDSDHFFYRRKVVPDNAAYTRGVQIIRPRPPEKAVPGPKSTPLSRRLYRGVVLVSEARYIGKQVARAAARLIPAVEPHLIIEKEICESSRY